MRKKKHSALFILVLVVGILVNARDADARSYASLDEPIGEGLAVAADAFSRATTAGDRSLSVTAAAEGNSGGAGLPLLWSNLTSRIGSGMYAAYCLVFCDERNTGFVVGDGQDTSHPVMKQVDGRSTVNRQQPTVNDELVATDNQQSTENVEQRTVNDQPSTANTRPPSRPSDQKLVTGNQSITYTVLGISESDLAGALASLESRLLPQIRAARESARSNRSRSEASPRPTFLTLADTFSAFNPDAISFTNSEGNALTQSSSFVYQGGKLGVASSTPTETLSVGGSANIAGYLTLDQITPPAATTNRLYNSAGDLYWAGNLIGGASTGVWASNGSDVWRAGGRVGIGTTTPVHTLTVSTEVPLTDVDISALQGAGGKASIRAINNANQQTQISTFGYNATSTSLWSGVPSSGLSVWYANGVNAALVNHGSGDLYLINQYAAPRMTIASTTGYVGVATMNPKYRFDVSGAGRFTSFVDANSFVATGTQASSFPYASTTALTVSGTAYINALSSASALPLPNGYTFRGSSGNTAEATSALFVAESGNVGVGTVNPGALLHLSRDDTTTVGSGVRISNTNTTLAQWTLAARKDLGSDAFVIRENNPNTSDRIVLLSGGNVGIASTSPYAKLSVTNTGTGPSFVVEDTTSPDTTPFVIDASGNVGIGTMTPESSLTITRDTLGTTGNVNGLMINSATTPTKRLNFGVSGTNNYAYIDSINYSINNAGVPLILQQNGGNVGIGTTSPAFKLSVAGSVHASAFIDDGVTLAAPDYVFEDPDYLHLSLADIEAYTVAHKHLPWLTPRGSGAMSISARINEVLEALENLFLEVFELADWNRRQDEADAIRDQRIDALEAELRAVKAGSGSSQTNPGPAEQAVDAPAPTATSEAPEFSEPATLDSGAVAVSASATSF